MKLIAIAIVLIMLGTGAPQITAATITVDWAGSGDYTNIMAGIAAAGPGDTVLVLAGTYAGSNNRDLNFGGTNLVLISDEGYAATVIDCWDGGRGFLFNSGEDTTAVVRGFTITDAVADSGAGAFCDNGSSPRFEDCLFLSNTAQKRGGGLCCKGSSPIVRSCRFEQNTADDGASNGYGGGMACLAGSAPLVEDSEFAFNQSRSSGGGLLAYYGPLTCTGCTFEGNNVMNYASHGAGGALAFSDGAVFSGCTFIENGTSSIAIGGGLHVDATAMTIADCSFLDNRAGSSGGIHFINGSSGTVSGCTFAGNEGTWSASGAISCYFGSDPTVTGCTFANNQVDHVWCKQSSPTIEYSILAFASPGIAVVCTDGTEAPHIHHSFICANAGGDTLCGGNYNDIMNDDPLFCDRAGGVFTVCENSPCLPGVTWPSLVGAHGQGCPPCESRAEPTRWGSIKALYRQ